MFLLPLELQEVDFGDKELTAKIINNFVDNTTNHLIKEVVKPSSLNSDTKLMFINAVYFFGKWETQFKKENTLDMEFKVEDNKMSKIPGMNVESEFNQVKLPSKTGGEIGVLEMPYKDKDFAMYVILPPNGTDIRDFDWEELNLATVHNKMERKRTVLRVPKFNIEFEKNLANLFKEMCVVDAFTSAGTQI